MGFDYVRCACAGPCCLTCKNWWLVAGLFYQIYMLLFCLCVGGLLALWWYVRGHVACHTGSACHTQRLCMCIVSHASHHSACSFKP